MAQKLLKRKPRKVAPTKAQVEETGMAGAPRTPSAVLVGTYKEGQFSWIKRHGIYNYPVKDGDEFDEKSFASIKELWLYADVKGTRHVFEAEFIGIKTREELVDEYGYPANGVFNAETQRRRGGRARTLAAPHGSRYYVFNAKHLDYGSRLDAPLVIVRAADFGGRSQKVKKAVGTFYGGDGDTLSTITVSKVGKVSGKVLFENGGRWTIVGSASGQRIAAVLTDAEGNSAAVGFVITRTGDGCCRIESEDGTISAERQL